MRFLIPCGVGIALLSIFGLGSGCTAGIPAAGDGGVDEGGPRPRGDGSAFDSSVGFDSGTNCSMMNATYDKTCSTASDCTTVARGCYCGSQPVIGIARTAASTAQACEAQAATCGLGCPTMSGRTAEDGKSDVDGGTITVLCDSNRCHTVVR